MSSVEMVVTNILRQQALQMPLVERNHVIQQVVTTTFHPTLRNSILPRAVERSSDGFQAQCSNSIVYRFSELGIAIKNQILVLRIIRKGFAQLLCNPETGRVPSNVAVQNASTVMVNFGEGQAHCSGYGHDLVFANHTTGKLDAGMKW